MRAIRYFCVDCGNRQHENCTGYAFYEFAKDVRTGHETLTPKTCECSHVEPTAWTGAMAAEFLR